MTCVGLQGDIFSGLNDGLLTRAEALAAVDIGKHQGAQCGPGAGSLPQLKHDMMYHHGMAAPPHNARPHQVPHASSSLLTRYPLPGKVRLSVEVRLSVKARLCGGRGESGLCTTLTQHCLLCILVSSQVHVPVNTTTSNGLNTYSSIDINVCAILDLFV
jgi:hypothetical protein